jgi:ABC-2 type transport system ATP-binding protein
MRRLDLKNDEKDWGLAKVDELSRGMQQKVQFIGTLVHDPDLVILDEPFSGLDPINAQALKDAIVELKSRGKTVIFSTHVMDTAERLCDSVCIIARGRKVLDGGVAEVRRAHSGRNVALAVDGDARPLVAPVLADRRLISRVDDNNRYYELELAPGADAQEVLRRVVATGAAIQRFELVLPSLHQIFLERVGARNVEPGLTDG